MKRRYRISALVLDPVLVIGTVISVALGVLFYLRQDLAPALATVAGLLGLVITLQIQAMLQERRDAARQSRIGSMITTIEEIEWLPGVLEPALRGVRHLGRLTRQFETIERNAVAIDEQEPAGQPVAFC